MQADKGRVWTRAFTLVVAATFCYFLAFMFFFPVLPFYITSLGMRESAMGLLLGVSALTSLALRPFIGRMIDRKGSRRAMSLGAALFTLSVLGYLLAVT